MEYNNSLIINLKASPSQILQSRVLKTQLPVTNTSLEPRIQKGVYELLVKQKDLMKSNYDKIVRRNPFHYKVGDNVVIKSERDKIWYKAIVEKAKEPRSYWVRKESNNKIIRRNTTQMRPSVTKPEHKFLNEPEMFPKDFQNDKIMLNDDRLNCNRRNSLNSNNRTNNVNQHNSSDRSFSSPSNIVPHDTVSNSDIKRDNVIEYNRSRFGRYVKPPQRLNL